MATVIGVKKFEFRRDDRTFRIGDLLELREWDPRTEQFSGDTLTRRVTYILNSSSGFGVPEGYVVMSLEVP
jgi:hypothetical protein